MTRPASLLIIILLAALLAQPAALAPLPDMSVLPVTGGTGVTEQITDTLPTLAAFIAAVKNGEGGQLRGLYVPGILALPVVQQADGDNTFVSTQPGEVTQFGLADMYGTIGLLAHNYLAGADFFELETGQTIVLVYGDGRLAHYQVQLIEQYQALQPDSPYSSYVNLQTGEQLSTADTFARIYQGGSRRVLQTCIAADGEDSWGRLFVVAQPIIPPSPIEMVRQGSSALMAGLAALEF